MLLILLSLFIVLYLIYYFTTHSPRYVTETMFVGSIAALGTAMFSGFLSLWIKISGFAEDVGRIKEKLDQKSE